MKTCSKTTFVNFLFKVGIQASRISTALHQKSELGSLPGEVTSCNLLNPLYTFKDGACSGSAILRKNAVAARVLLALVVPGNRQPYPINIKNKIKIF